MKISNIYKRYKASNFKLEVDSLELLDNKINIVIGENGCGKSTLLKYILEQYDDSIMMLQSPYIFNKTVEENLELVKKICKSKVEIDWILEVVNLSDKRNMQAYSLSGGEKQRLAFASVIMSDKQTVLLDEPFNGIDVYSQKVIVDLIKTIKNKMFIIVTHKLNHAKSFGDYFIYMHLGKVNVKGESESFFNEDVVKEFARME